MKCKERNKAGTATKRCAYCLQDKPIGEFRRRTGRKAGKHSRRGACRECRRLRRTADGPAAMFAGDHARPGENSEAVHTDHAVSRGQAATPHPALAATGKSGAAAPPDHAAAGMKVQTALTAEKQKHVRKPPRRGKKKAVRPPLPPPPPRPAGPDPSILVPDKSGVIWMRGRTDKGRRWRQETDLETAVTLVREYAAVVVNRRTIRRLYSNKAFRKYILQRDNYTCYFCGQYGDTIDHIVPRAKGGHTTPVNCVTACHECNQNKAALDLDEFMEKMPPRSGHPS